MKTMAISEFKAHALKVINDVSKSKETIIITKRGKPLARVVPHHKPESQTMPGRLADVFAFEKDIVTPLGDDAWDACQ